jgi:hypothetical protein
MRMSLLTLNEHNAERGHRGLLETLLQMETFSQCQAEYGTKQQNQ